VTEGKPGGEGGGGCVRQEKNNRHHRKKNLMYDCVSREGGVLVDIPGLCAGIKKFIGEKNPHGEKGRLKRKKEIP